MAETEFDKLLGGSAVVPETAGQPTAFDSLLEDDEASRNAARRSTFSQAQTVKPDAQAQILDLSRKTGIDTDTVSRNTDEVKREQAASEFDKLVSGAPATGGYFENGDNAKVASDAVPMLVDIENKLKALRANVPDAGTFLAGFVESAGQSISGLGRLYGAGVRSAENATYAALEEAGFNSLSEFLKGARTPWWVNPEAILRGPGSAIQSAAHFIDPHNDNPTFTQEVTKGLGQMAGQVAVAIWTGNYAGLATTLALVGQGAEQVGQDVEQTLGPDAKPTPATDTAIVLGAGITALTERFGLGQLLEYIPATVRSRVGRVLASASSEAAQEFSEQLLQNITALALYDPQRDLIEGAGENAGVGGAVGAIVGAIVPGRQAIRSKQKADEVFDATRASPLTQRSPIDAANHFERVLEQAAINDVYVPADKLLELDPEGKLGVPQAKLDEALTLGGDVKLTQQQTAQLFINPDLYPVIGEHLRFGRDSLTEAEAKDLASQEAIRELADEQQPPVASDGDAFFDPKAIAAAKDQSNASRETVVHMSPDDFLSLAAELTTPSAEKAAGVNALVEAGTPLSSIPLLKIEKGDAEGVARVFGHEGRHRALELKSRGVQSMPVTILASDNLGIRWGQTDARPTTLSGQGRDTLVDFPEIETYPLNAPTLPEDVTPETAREIELAEEMMGLQALFRTAKEAGMTQPAYEKYLLAVDKAKARSQIAQERKKLQAEKKKLSAQYQEVFAAAREIVEQEVRAEPVYMALDAIGRDRLSQDSITSIIQQNPTPVRDDPYFDHVTSEKKNTNQADTLLAEVKALKVDGRSIVAPKSEPGVSASALASRFGFDNAYEMLRLVLTAKPVKQEIFDRTEARVKAENPELVQDVANVQSAIEELHSDAYADVLAYELNALRAARGAGAIKPALLRAEARRRLGEYKINDIDPAQFLCVERIKARETGKLVRKGDREGAARAKFQQLLNFEMARMAYAAQDKIASQRKELAKLAKPRQKWKNIDADYVDQIHEYLERINLMAPLSEEKRMKILDFAAEKASKNGSVFVVPPLVLANDNRIQFGDLTLNEWKQFYETVKNLEKQGRLVKEIGRGKKQRDFDEVKAELIEATDKLPELPRQTRQRKTQNPGFKDKVIHTLAGLDAAVRKTEFLLTQLDGGDIGAWHRAVFQPIADAQTRQLDFIRKHVKPLLDKLQKLPPEAIKRMGEEVYVAGLDRKFRRSDILAMALNTGNESNYRKMIEGSKKDNDAAEWTDAGVEEALSHLSESEAKWVQEVWDTFEKAYPMVEEIYRNENGISPERIEPREVQIGGKTLKGGYFPMLYDASRSLDANKSKIETSLDAMQSPVIQASVFSGMTQERTGYSAPVLLDVRKLPYAFQQLAHFVTHYDAVRDVRKILHDPELVKAVRNKLGPEYHQELVKWLDDVAVSGMTKVDMTKWDEATQFFRTNVTAAVMGYSYTTGVAQTFGLTSSVAVLGRGGKGKFKGRSGLDWMMVGLEKYLAHPVAATKEAFRLSGELRHRLENTDREIAYAMDSFVRKGGTKIDKARQFLQDQQRASLLMIGGIQLYSVDLPTWIAAFNKGLAEDMTEEKAVQYADHVLRTSQATGHEKDLSALQRKKGLWRAVTMFSSYTMLFYNLQAQTYGETRKIRDLPSAVARLGWLVVLPAMMDALLRAEGPDDDKDESWASWFAKKAIGYAASAIPVVGRGVDAMFKGFNPELAAIESIGKSAMNLITQTKKAYEDEPTVKTLEAYVRAFGTILGIGGTYQIGRVLDAIAAEDDATFYDYLIGHKDK